MHLFAFLLGCHVFESADVPCAGKEDCSGDEQPETGVTDTGPIDADGDGFFAADDCDDEAAGIFPGATERCDGRDQDCDGDIDEDFDADRDGELDASACEDGTDCDDNTASVGTREDEVPYDGLDNDCDADTPDDDLDGDGYTRRSSDDCDDADPARNPDAMEACNGIDDDCDAESDEGGAVTIEGGESFATIQDAIDAASAGDTLAVCPGTYYEALEIDTSLALYAPYGLGTVSVDASGGLPAIEVSGGEVTIEGLELTGGTGLRIDGYMVGGGLLVDRGAVVYLDSAEVTGNSSSLGGGAWVRGTLVATDSIFAENDAYTGGALYVDTLGEVELSAVQVRENTAEYGGGVWVDGALSVTDGRFRGNAATGADESFGGAGVTNTSATVSLDAVTLDYNTAGYGGAWVTFGVDTATDCTFSDNTASLDGGSLYVAGGGSSELNGGVVEYGSAEYGGGAIVYGTLAARSTAFKANSASFTGGAGSLLPGSVVTLASVEVSGNSADFAGGWYVGGRMDSSGSTFEGNTASTSGGAAYIGTSGELSSASDLFTGNEANYGGAWIVEGSAVASDSELSRNIAYMGGGFYSYATVSFDGGSVVDNAAEYGGGFYLNAGSSVELLSTELSRNAATTNGGGGGLTAARRFSLDGALVQENTADNLGGGLLFASGGTAKVASSTISGNTSVRGGGGVLIFENGLLDASAGRNDWGSGSSDNSPDDILLYGGSAYTGVGSAPYCELVASAGSCR